MGHGLDLVQANCSVSARGVLSGIHFADVPPGQAKYVTCVAGSCSTSSSTSAWVRRRSASGRRGTRRSDRRAVYLSEGLGHAFLSLADGCTVVYLCSQDYHPTGEHEVHPLDPAIGIEWGMGEVEARVVGEGRVAPSRRRPGAFGLSPTTTSAGLSFRADG